MPQELDIDREAVRVLTVAVGPREAARQMGLKEATVLQWCHRGDWLAHTKPENQPQLPPSMQKQPVIGVISPAVALAKSINDNWLKSKANQAEYCVAATAEGLAAPDKLAVSAQMANVASIQSKLDPPAKDQRLNISISQGNSVVEIDGPIIDLPE